VNRIRCAMMKGSALRVYPKVYQVIDRLPLLCHVVVVGLRITGNSDPARGSAAAAAHSGDGYGCPIHWRHGFTGIAVIPVRGVKEPW
jgi:hypothetical protein